MIKIPKACYQELATLTKELLDQGVEIEVNLVSGFWEVQVSV